MLAGESGIGKSRLISEFSDSARARGATVLVGECLQLTEGELPYAAIIAALRGLLRGGAGDEMQSAQDAERERLEALLHDLGSGAGGQPETTPASVAQARLFERLLDTISALARRAPTVLILEDLHWADRSTGDFVSFLVRNARRERLLLLASYRSEELHRRHPLGPVAIELQRSGRAVLVSLQPFARDELVQQLTAILAGPPEPARVDRARRFPSRCARRCCCASSVSRPAHSPRSASPRWRGARWTTRCCQTSASCPQASSPTRSARPWTVTS